jgi:CP family cyanate transporter-like MFS transporter
LFNLLLLWLCGLTLRLTILAVPPILPALRGEFDLSGTEVAILSGLPVLLFAIAALPGSLLVGRWGAKATFIGGLLVAAVGAALRALSHSSTALYAATALMSAGIAVVQPVMPVLVREWTPARIGLATAVYTNGFLVGEILPVLFAPMILSAYANDWRIQISAWAIPLVGIAAVVLFAAPARQPLSASPATGARRARAKLGLVLRLACVFGATNALYFGSNAFIPGHLGGAGRPDLVASALVALNLSQLPASLLMLVIMGRVEGRAWPYIACGALSAVGLAGLTFGGGAWSVAAAGLLGFSTAAGFTLALALIPRLSPPGEIAGTSVATFAAAYGTALVLALAGGALWDLGGRAAWAFLPLALCPAAIAGVAWSLKRRGALA